MGAAGTRLIAAADTSVVLNLAWLRQDRLWPALFDRVLAPPEVQAEFQRLASVDDRFRGLRFPDFVVIELPGRTPAGRSGFGMSEFAQGAPRKMFWELQVSRCEALAA